MIRDWIDPNGAAEIFTARVNEARRQYRECEASEAVFGAVLYGLGFTTAQIRAEVQSSWEARESFKNTRGGKRISRS